MPSIEPQLDSSAGLKKFNHPNFTAEGDERAVVELTHLKTLWFNTGSLCNIACKNCFMESSPKNDALVYLSIEEVKRYLDEAKKDELPIEEIGFTGGEPFMNKSLIKMIKMSLSQGYQVLVLSNAMRPMHHKFKELLHIKKLYGSKLTIRISIDHYTRSKHELIRGPNTWAPMLRGIHWLATHGFNLAIAGRACWNESDEQTRAGYANLFKSERIPIDASKKSSLVLFPEMDNSMEVPEITAHCWDILDVTPGTMMCATSRMIVKRKGDIEPSIVPCTLLPYDKKFELGYNLSESSKTVHLNHPHCSKFCVLGGATCNVG